MKNSPPKYKVLLNNSVSAILFTKLDGSILEVNQTAVIMFGYSQEEFIKLCRQDIIDHTDQTIPELLAERSAKGTIKGELTGIRKNGEKFPIRFSSTLFQDEDGLEYSCTTIQDISERKKSEQEMALMIDNTEESFVLLDADLHIVSFNKQFKNRGKRYFGFEAKKGDYIIDYVPEEQAQELKEVYTLVLKGAKQKKEIVVPTAEGDTKYFILTYTPTIVDKTVTGIFVTARDITEETESQLAIKETKFELEKIMNCSLDIICTIDAEGNFVKISNASEKVWGYKPDELVGKKYTEHIHPDDLEKSKIVTQQIIAGFDQTNFQNRYIKKDGTIVPVIWSAKWDDTEKMIYCIVKDATEKVKQEAAIIESGKLYKNLFESSPAPMFIFDFETLQIIDCNEETVLKYGYTKEEFLTFTIKDIRPPEDREKIEKAVVDETTYGQIHKKVWRHQKKNGDIMFMDISGHLITYNDRRMSLVMLIDVTEKLKAEEQREFEKRDKEALINSTDDLIWSVSTKFKLLAANQAFVRNLEQSIGFTIKTGDDLILDNVYSEGHLDFWKCYYSRALAGESFIEEVKSPSSADQKEVWYEITFNPIYKEGEVVGIACYARNITENKKIKKELLDSEEKYRLLFYNNPLPNWIYDTQTFNIVDVNETAIAHYGYSKDEFLSMNLKDLRTEEDFLKLQESIDEGIKSNGVSQSGIFTHRKKNGELIKVEVSGHNISYQGKKSRIVVCNDVTDRENALRVLKDKESKLRNAQQIAKLGYWERDIATGTLFWSAEVYKIWGIKKTIKPSFDLFISTIHPEDIDAFMAEQYAVVLGKKEMDIEHRILLKDGTIKWVHEKAKVQKSPDGQNVMLDGTVQDITERKKIEEKLKESIQRYENATKATDDAIWDWDLVNNSTYRAEGFRTSFGFDLEKLNSPETNWKNHIHPDDEPTVTKSLFDTISSNENYWNQEYRIIKSDGNEAFVQDRAYLIRNKNNKAVRIVGALKDISESKYYHNVEILEREILELNALGDIPIEDIIGKYMLGIEKLHAGMLCSMQLIKGEQLFNLAAPSLPENFLKAINGNKIGNNAGSCGTAAYLKQRVIVTDIPNDIRWTEYKELARYNDLKACWSNPIINSDGEVLATFAAYYREIKAPSILEENSIERAGHILQVILVGYLKEKALIESNLRYENVTKATSDAIWDWDLATNKVLWGATFNHLFGKMNDETLSDENKVKKRLHPAEAEQIFQSAKAAIKSKDLNWSYEHRYLKGDGSYAYVLNKVLIIRDSNGRAIRVIGAMQDISERKNEELQNELIATISKVFNESILLHETLDRALSYIIDFGGFCFAEAWLASTDRTMINRVSSTSFTENMKLFLTETTADQTFIGGEGIVGTAAKTKELIIWEDLSNKKDFRHGKAAGKIDLKTIIALPLLYNNDIIGVLTFGIDYSILDTAKYTSLFKSLSNYLAPEIKRKQLEQELNQLFNFAPDIIAIVGLDGYFKKINPVTCELLGYTEEELYAVPYANFIHPDDRNKSTDEAVKLPKTNHTFYFENRYITKSGSIKHLAWNAVYAKEENNIYAVAKDITEKKELEDLLQKANKLARIGGWELDLEKNTVFWSEITKEIHEVETDYIPDLETGLSFYKKGRSRRAISRYIKRAFKTGKSWDDEFQIITDKGNERWIRVIGEVEHVNGNYNRIYGSFQDIDERKKAEEKIKNSEERRKLIMNAALDAIICIDKEGIVTFWNPQAEQIFGWKATEVMGKLLSELIIPEDYRVMHENGMKNYLNTGKGPALNVLLQLSAIRRSGEEFPIELTVLPIKQDDEEFFCAFIRDISERKTYETRLIELNDNLKKQKAELVISNNELEQFAYIASHDLQEPLRMVTSFLTLLNKKYGANFDETATSYIDFAVDGAKRMRQLILDLLEYSRVGKASEIEEFIDLNNLIAEIKILYRKQIEEINADIIVIEPLPLIKSHKSPVLQLFQNLISNALKYSRKDVAPTVEISFTSYDDYWEFKIEDNGIGIDEEYFEKIFVIFQRLHNKDTYSGTGMGLAVTKKVVESLGGRIWLKSTINVGSEFYFTIPKKNI